MNAVEVVLGVSWFAAAGSGILCFGGILLKNFFHTIRERSVVKRREEKRERASF
jgi:hypothetical protein